MCFRGDFVNGNFEGYGWYEFDDGYYEGEWKGGKEKSLWNLVSGTISVALHLTTIAFTLYTLPSGQLSKEIMAALERCSTKMGVATQGASWMVLPMVWAKKRLRMGRAESACGKMGSSWKANSRSVAKSRGSGKGNDRRNKSLFTCNYFGIDVGIPSGAR